MQWVLSKAYAQQYVSHTVSSWGAGVFDRVTLQQVVGLLTRQGKRTDYSDKHGVLISKSKKSLS